MDGKYTLGEIRLACENMAKGGAVEIKNEIFVQPTPVGEELIAALAVPPPTVPPFKPPDK